MGSFQPSDRYFKIDPGGSGMYTMYFKQCTYKIKLKEIGGPTN